MNIRIILISFVTGCLTVAGIFESPEEFIPDRNWYNYFHFGFGSHECLGRYVGMVMIPEMVRQVLSRPAIKARNRIDYESGPFPEQYDLFWSTYSTF